MNTLDTRHTQSSLGAIGETAGFATPVEAAKFLRLSKAMVHKLIGEGKMPACRYGRAVRIPWSWLRAEAAN
jgi:excisionase family DNA binding protein